MKESAAVSKLNVFRVCKSLADGEQEVTLEDENDIAFGISIQVRSL